MIVFINFQGNPLHALGGFLLCAVFNLLFDFLSSSGSNFLWLELAASAIGLLVTGLLLAAGLRYFIGGPRGPAGLPQFAASFFGGAAGNANQRPQTAQQRQQRWDKVVRALQQLPTDVVASEAELHQLTAHELKERLSQAGGTCSNCLEKPELVRALLEVGGSSGDSCCICCEDYTSGDVVRVLPCKHRFHIECVDKWFLSSTDYSRPPACPMCNAELAI